MKIKKETVAEVAGFVGNILVGSLSVMVLKNVTNPITIFDKVVTVGGGFLVSEMIGEKVDEYISKEVNEVADIIDTFKNSKKEETEEE